MSYYNTTNIQGRQLQEYISTAIHQDDKILEFFTHNPEEKVTAEELQRWILPECPLTSTRRALSNLHKSGQINKGPQVEGMYGRPIHTWSLS